MTARGPAAPLLGALLAVLTACAGCNSGGRASGGGGASSGGSVLRVPQAVEPTTLDPAKVEDGPTIELLMHVFEGLIQWTPESKLAPALAERWEVSSDGKTYTFHL